MSAIKKIIPILCLPLAFLMLVTGISLIPRNNQEQMEAALAAETEEPFAPVFRFAVASDVHISASDDTTAKRLGKLFETAYRYARSQAYPTLDAVVLVGDNCDSGSEEEYDWLFSASSNIPN